MATRGLTLIPAVFLVAFMTFGQKSTFIGLIGSLNYDVYEFTDPGNIIQPIPLPSGSWGGIIGQEVGSALLIETGLIRKYYYEGFGYSINSVVSGFSSNSFETWQIPFRLKAHINLVNNKLFLSPAMGLHLSINTEYGNGLGYGGGSLESDEVSIYTFYTEDVSLSKVFSLLETGLYMDYRFLRDFILSLNVSYLHGFKKVSQLVYLYQVDHEENFHEAYAHSNGDYWNIGLSIHYRLSNLWTH